MRGQLIAASIKECSVFNVSLKANKQPNQTENESIYTALIFISVSLSLSLFRLRCLRFESLFTLIYNSAAPLNRGSKHLRALLAQFRVHCMRQCDRLAADNDDDNGKGIDDENVNDDGKPISMCACQAMAQ